MNNGKINEQVITVEYARSPSLRGRRNFKRGGSMRKVFGRRDYGRGRRMDGRRGFGRGRGRRFGQRGGGRFPSNRRTMRFKHSLGRNRRGR